MQSEPSKYVLLHFTRSRMPPPNKVRLDNVEVSPSTSTRLLSVWLDRKLTWKAHLKEI